MRAINAITEEDDFYFERWQEKQKRMRGLMSLQESLSQPVRADAGSSKRGDNKVRNKAERGKSFDNLQSRRIKSRSMLSGGGTNVKKLLQFLKVLRN